MTYRWEPCTITGKRCYPSVGDARFAMEDMRAVETARGYGDNAANMSVYWCDHCSGFHFGHTPGTSRRSPQPTTEASASAPQTAPESDLTSPLVNEVQGWGPAR